MLGLAYVRCVGASLPNGVIDMDFHELVYCVAVEFGRDPCETELGCPFGHDGPIHEQCCLGGCWHKTIRDARDKEEL
jgi:hypothetical protein